MSGVGYNGRPGSGRDNFSMEDALHMLEYFDELDLKYTLDYQESNRQKENIINYWLQQNPELYRYLRDAYFNESLADIVKKVFEKNQILEYKGELVQQINPIYRDPLPDSFFNFRSHFYAPSKHFMGRFYDTFYFNIIFVWILTLILYATLYFNLLKKSIEGFEKLDFRFSLPRKPAKSG